MSNTDQEKYKGTGKLTSAWGGWSIGGTVGSLIAAPFAYKTYNKAIKALDEGGRNKEVWQGAIKNLGLILLIPVATAVIGAVKGYNRAKHGKQQFEQLKHQNELVSQENAYLKQAVSMQSQVAIPQRSFAQSFAAPQGSHLEQVQADAAAAQEAGRSV